MSFLDSAGHFTSILVYFMLKNETSDFIMTSYFSYTMSYGKTIAIFRFSIPNYVQLVTFGRKIKFANFQSLGNPLHDNIRLVCLNYSDLTRSFSEMKSGSWPKTKDTFTSSFEGQ